MRNISRGDRPIEWPSDRGNVKHRFYCILECDYSNSYPSQWYQRSSLGESANNLQLLQARSSSLLVFLWPLCRFAGKRTQHGCYFSERIKLQNFSKISPGFPDKFPGNFHFKKNSEFVMKIFNVQELHLNIIYKTAFVSLFQQFKGNCIVPSDRKQKIWGLPFFWFHTIFYQPRSKGNVFTHVFLFRGDGHWLRLVRILLERIQLFQFF